MLHRRSILNRNKRLGHSKKGWTDCELAVLWLTHFEKHTAGAANGHARLLVVDGHNSHYSFEFLNYACTHKIHVLCYPAHTTHVYQGLDVVVFSVLKQCWADERTKWEANGGEVSKETFLTIYGAAHIKTLSPTLIKKAFEKTGIWPFNPNVVPVEMMAPSKETSREGHLPFAPSTPIRIAARHLEYTLFPPAEKMTSPTNSVVPGVADDVAAVVDFAVHQLRDPAVDYLTRNSPIKATSQLPPLPTTTLSPIKQWLPNLLQHDATTPLERVLMKKLQDSVIKETYLKGKVVGLQSTVILQNAYLHRVQGQLEAREGKRNKGGGVLNDGHARLLTEDEFVEKVAERDRQKASKQAEKEQRKAMMAEYKVVLDEWKKVEGERKRWNIDRRLEWKREVEEWNRLKGKGRGKRPLLGEKKATARPTRPSADIVEDSEVSLAVRTTIEEGSDNDGSERLG